jgi:hypothetical protein
MKISFKATPEQYAVLVHSVSQMPFDFMFYKLDFINAKYFYYEANNRVNKLYRDSKIFSKKTMTFKIDINHYNSLKNIFKQHPYLSSYVVSVFRSIELIAERAMLAEISRLQIDFKGP